LQILSQSSEKEALKRSHEKIRKEVQGEDWGGQKEVSESPEQVWNHTR
jgi:hypothetical protein